MRGKKGNSFCLGLFHHLISNIRAHIQRIIKGVIILQQTTGLLDSNIRIDRREHQIPLNSVSNTALVHQNYGTLSSHLAQPCI